MEFERVELLINYLGELRRLSENHQIDNRMLDRAVAELDKLLIKNHEEK